MKNDAYIENAAREGKLLMAAALSAEAVPDAAGRPLHCAAVLPQDSPKRRALLARLAREPAAFFLRAHARLERALGCGEPLVIVTDWTDPSEVVGLRLQDERGQTDAPDLCFLALETNWEDLDASGIEEIFGHELSHLWLHRMGYRPERSPSNRFHTSTAITDPYLAFFEGFAESLEILSAERMGPPEEAAPLYDDGYDAGAWLCARDTALRLHAVRNNRFLYRTADLRPEDFPSYSALHMAHSASSAFLPERLKNGLQAVSSEGLIASFFFRLFSCRACLEAPLPAEVFARFCAMGEDLSPQEALLLKVLFAMMQLDFSRPTLFVDFAGAYLSCFPAEREAALAVFCRVTNFVTVDAGAPALFGELYRVGIQGDPEAFRRACLRVRAQKAEWTESLLRGDLPLGGAVAPSLWIEADKEVLSVPWDPESAVRLRVDVNAATEVDLFALEGLTLPQCREIVKIREERGGFPDLAAFWACVDRVRRA